MAEDVDFDPRDAQEVVEDVVGDREKPVERERQPRWVGLVALTTALLSVVAAVSALQASSSSDEALAASNRAVLLQTQASDQWAYYQAKGLKYEVRNLGADLLTTSKGPEAQIGSYKSEASRAQGEQADISRQATDLEKQSEEARAESAALDGVHHRFAYAVTLFQVAIALSAVAALTRQRTAWFGGLLSGAAGLVFFASGFLA